MVEELKTTTPKPFVFVLMPFDPVFNDIYKFGIKGAADDAGAYAERIDEQMFVEGILDRIYNQINKADVIVADMTGRNPNVFYEVGYAHALGKIVVLLTQKADDIPFDLKHYPHIVYSGSIGTLREDLTKRLLWAIDESKRHTSAQPRQKLLVSIESIAIPEVTERGPIPEVTSKWSDVIYLTVQFRNGGRGISEFISHIYLFADEEFGKMAKLSGNNWSGILKASPEDCQDGLVIQYQIKGLINSLPVGATEHFRLEFMWRTTTARAFRLRLRLHDSMGPLDYPFLLQVAKPI